MRIPRLATLASLALCVSLPVGVLPAGSTVLAMTLMGNTKPSVLSVCEVLGNRASEHGRQVVIVGRIEANHYHGARWFTADACGGLAQGEVEMRVRIVDSPSTRSRRDLSSLLRSALSQKLSASRTESKPLEKRSMFYSSVWGAAFGSFGIREKLDCPSGRKCRELFGDKNVIYISDANALVESPDQ